MTSFKEIGLSNDILKAIKELGFEKPSEIQEKSIPVLLNSPDDFIGLAQTGTGKTAAFGLPLIDRLDPSDKSTQALILAPTRELGQQIAEQLKLYGKHKKRINMLAVYGGANIMTQIKALKNPQHIIIATPGRLIDLISRKAVRLDRLQFLILDEADEMLNMGFKEDIDKILSYAPEDKLTWLFSATMPKEIRKIVDTYMHNPTEVKVNTKNEVNKNIDHQYVVVNQKNKADVLKRFLDIQNEIRGIVFCRTKRNTQNLAEKLLKQGYKADALHGDLSQNQRDRVMKRFRDNELQVLIATDVAARGIDVDDLSHVFHFSLPDDNAYYTHRSGRTARAGKQGISICFIGERDGHRVRKLEKQLGIKINKVEVPDAEDIIYTKIENWCHSVMRTGGTEKLDKWLLEQVNMVFEDLTKEELVAKFLSRELHRLNISSQNLNVEEKKERRSDSKDKKGRRSGGHGKKGGGHRKDKGGGKKSSSRRSGGGSKSKKGKYSKSGGGKSSNKPRGRKRR